VAGFDFSMYPQNSGQNPLQTLSSLVGIQGQAINNNITMRAATAQQALGEATQGATNPDGSFDPSRFMGLVRGDPRAAFEAQKAAEFAQQQRVSQLSVALEKQTQFNSVLGSTLSEATKPDGTFDEAKIDPGVIAGRVGEMVNMGVLDAKTAASELASMPTDPSQRFQWLKGHLAQGMAAQQQVEAAFGQLVQNDNGAQIVSNRAPVMGPGTIPTIQKQMSPGEAAQPVQGPVGPNGETTTEPLGERAGQGKITTGKGPAFTAAAGVSGQGNAQQGMALQQQAQEVPNIKAILGHMAGDLKYFQTGPGTSEWKELLAAGINLGIPVNKNAVASQENFNKFAVMLAQRTGQQFGLNSSDQRFLSSVESNPNQQLSKEGNRRIINILKGNADALATANQVWQNWQQQGHGGETFGRFMSKFNSQFDPRIFQMQYMNADEKQRMMQGMSASERQQFQQKLAAAQSRGWVGK
jgi:hypothetical protein